MIWLLGMIHHVQAPATFALIPRPLQSAGSEGSGGSHLRALPCAMGFLYLQDALLTITIFPFPPNSCPASGLGLGLK